MFTKVPMVQHALRLFGSAYLLYLAYQMLSFSSLHQGDSTSKPLSLIEATAFQAVNPKVWIMVISANASFSLEGERYWLSVAMIVIMYIVAGTPSNMLWAGFGQFMRHFLGQPTILRLFNISMATLTALCVIFIWID